MTCSKEYIERAENAVLHTYNRFPVVFDHGEGVYLYDLEGKKYRILERELLFFPWDMGTRSTMRR